MLILRLIQSTSTSSQPPRAVATNAKSICYNALHTRSWVKLKSSWRDCRTLGRLAELTQLAARNSRLGRLSDLRLELSCVCHNLLRIPEAEQNLCTMLAFIGWLRNVDCCVNDMARKRESEIERKTWRRAWGGGQTRSERDTRTEIHSSVANLLVVWIHHKASERSFVADHQLKNRANDEHKTWACGYVCAQCDGVWMGSLDSKCLCCGSWDVLGIAEVGTA